MTMPATHDTTTRDELFGAADDAWPPGLQEDMARRLGAQARVIERAAHSPAAERPGETAAALLEFWEVIQVDMVDAWDALTLMIADAGLTAIDDRRLSEDEGLARTTGTDRQDR
mgnify:CR=1 FL=1